MVPRVTTIDMLYCVIVYICMYVCVYQVNSGSGGQGSYATPTGSPYMPGGPRHSLDRFSFPSSSADSLDQSDHTPTSPHYHHYHHRGHGITDYSTPQLSRGRASLDFGTPQLSRGPGGRGGSACRRPMSSSFSGVSSNEEERFSVGVGHGRGSVANRGRGSKGVFSRSEPDGQSDVSSTSPDMLGGRRSQQGSETSSRHSTLSPPPPSSSPVPPDATLATPIIPDVLQSALDALEGIPDKDTPLSLTPRPQYLETGGQGVLPETVTSALTKWISSQSLQGQGGGANTSGGPSHSSLKTTPLLTPPPSTPVYRPPQTVVGGPQEMQGAGERQGISAGDLIAALSTLKVTGSGSGDEKGAGSRGSGGGGGRDYSVPAGTPSEGAGAEGGIEGWAKLGIRPDEVIQALSALTIQQVGEGRGGGGRLHDLVILVLSLDWLSRLL